MLQNLAFRIKPGGDLKEGTIVHPTAEVIIGYDDSVEFTREFDQETGFDELVVG